MKKTPKPNLELFQTKLFDYKKRIDEDINSYAESLYKSVVKQYGEQACVPVDAFLAVLKRGGKRLRGALTIYGYEMCGGLDSEMITQAARAVEMIHAYLLIMDDIQDRSVLRRGEPTVHIALAQYHKKNKLMGDADHFGVALALNAMGIGNHLAHIMLSELTVPDSVRLDVLKLLDTAIYLTAYGQTFDILNETTRGATVTDIKNVMEFKTAYYTILNPLHLGMTLGGANEAQRTAITDYALSVGRAFQIKDDLTGIFGTKENLGKSPLDDIREGKQTLLTVHTLENTSSKDRSFLLSQLGNKKLTTSQFEACKDIITRSGSLTFAKELFHSELRAARTSLKNYESTFKTGDPSFLCGLIEFLDTASE